MNWNISQKEWDMLIFSLYGKKHSIPCPNSYQNTLGRPQGFKITVESRVYVNAGAVLISTSLREDFNHARTSKITCCERIDYNEEENRIVGLF